MTIAWLEKSDLQILSGIPSLITLKADFPSSIHYTLDGSVPSSNSLIYHSPIDLSVVDNSKTIVVKFYATNGTLITPVYTESFSPQQDLSSARKSQFTTQQQILTPGNPQQAIYKHLDNPEKIVSQDGVPGIFNGYDGAGGQNNITSLPYTPTNYAIPGYNYNKGVIVVKKNAPTISNTFSVTFDPRALIIIQDGTQENSLIPPIILPNSFSTSKNKNRMQDWRLSAQTSAPHTVSFISQHYDQYNQTITYVFRDNVSNKWIYNICKVGSKYTPTNVHQGFSFGRSIKSFFTMSESINIFVGTVS